MPPKAADILRELHRLEAGSLFVYLAHSPSYVSPAANKWMPLLLAIGKAGEARVATLENLLATAEITPAPVSFPNHFTSLHYLSVDYLLRRLLGDKRAVATAYAQALSWWGDGDPKGAEGAAEAFVRAQAAIHEADLRRLETLGANQVRKF